MSSGFGSRLQAPISGRSAFVLGRYRLASGNSELTLASFGVTLLQRETDEENNNTTRNKQKQAETEAETSRTKPDTSRNARNKQRQAKTSRKRRKTSRNRFDFSDTMLAGWLAGWLTFRR